MLEKKKQEVAKIILRSPLLKKEIKEKLLREIAVKDEKFLENLKVLLLTSEQDLARQLAFNGVNTEVLGKGMDHYIKAKLQAVEEEENLAALASIEEKLK